MDEVEVISNSNTRLNSIMIEEARCYLSFIGNFCGSNSDNNRGCLKTADELLILWKGKIRRQGFKICECNSNDPDLEIKHTYRCMVCDGTKRIQPTLTVNEKKGFGLHRTINGKFELYGNVCYYCKSCQMLFDRRSGDEQHGKITWHSIKSHQIRPKFKNELTEFLSKNTEICYKFCINTWSGREDYKCSQDLLENSFDQEFGITFDLIDAVEYGIDCSYKKCNGNHIILNGRPPIVRTDYKALLDEEETNKKKDIVDN